VIGVTRHALVWRRASRAVVAHGPDALVRTLPSLFGVLAALALPDARLRVRNNLLRIRGERGLLEEIKDVASTFASYAHCFAELLSNGSKNARLPDLVVHGKEFIDDAVAAKRGIVLVTAHTAGWDAVGPVLGSFYDLPLVAVMRAEEDVRARELSDDARRVGGVEVAHAGQDPLASLPILAKLRRGAIVAMQVDRAPPGMRVRRVRLFGEPGAMPEGPLRLAQLSGAPILPVFCSRVGHRSYAAEASPPLSISRKADDGRIDVVAQEIADRMTRFVRRHPTQWFHFGES
jgi:phosphatidylinositol dimannoside acyltransferase